MSFLTIKNLSAEAGNFELKNINLRVEKGEFLSIIGRSGSGKTFLLETIAGLHKINGEVWLDNVNITNIAPQKRRIGMVYQDYMLFPNMNVKKNILYPYLFHKMENTKKLYDEIVDFLNIEPILNRDVRNLSGGEKQKVAIARALLSSPKLLLLDEPLNAVDFTFKTSFMEFLSRLHKRYNMTIIYVTHNFKEAEFFSKRIVVLLDGIIHQDDKTNVLFKYPKNRAVAEFLCFKNILPASLVNSEESEFFSVSPDSISVVYDKPQKDFVLRAEICEVRKTRYCYQLRLLLDKDTVVFANAKDSRFNIKDKVYIGFNKNDMGLFNG